MKKALFFEITFISIVFSMFYWIATPIAAQSALPVALVTAVLFCAYLFILNKKHKMIFLASLFVFFSYLSNVSEIYILAAFYVVYFFLDQVREFLFRGFIKPIQGLPPRSI